MASTQETDSEIIKRLSETKTIEDLNRIKLSLEGSIIISGCGPSYMELVRGLLLVNQAIDLKNKNN